MKPGAAISTRSLGKRFGAVQAVRDLELEVYRGEIYALLGRNGAGKTTTIRMLLGLIRPSIGEVELLGRRIRTGEMEIFRSVGYLVETAVAYGNLTVRENLDLQRRLTGAPRAAIAQAIDRLGLGQYADRRADRLSLGNLQRLAIARALLHAPDLLILDEPANALDPAGIVEVRELLRELSSEQGVTVFLSSHILAEVAHLADRIGIVHEGSLLEEVNRAQLPARLSRFIEVAASDPARARSLLEQASVGRVEHRDGHLRVYDAPGCEAEIARILVGAGLDLTSLTSGGEDLESFFLRRTGGDA